MSQSLSSWAKSNTLAKGTVHAKAKDLGIDTSNGLSDDAIEQLSKAFNLVTSTDDLPNQPNQEITINAGNHRIPGQLATVKSHIDLGHLREGSEMTTFTTQDLDKVDAAIELIGGVLDKVDQDVNYQIENLQKTQKASNNLNRKVDELKRRSDQYKTESKMLGLMQGNAAKDLQQAMQDLQNLVNPDS